MTLSTSFLWRGLLAIAVGVVSVAWPNVTVEAFVILFALYAFIAAAMDAMLAFSSSRAGPGRRLPAARRPLGRRRHRLAGLA
jgi:uncharacterized membrane protein HdeD (DUF308 family)